MKFMPATILLMLMSVVVSVYNVRLVKANEPITLLTNLEYPKGLWIKNNRVYITETNGRSTVFGGKICLDLYNAATGQKTVLVDHPECSDAVVVAGDNKIYLTSWWGSIPGNTGNVTVVDPVTYIETHLLDIEIASGDMFIDADDNILVIGSSDTVDAKSIYLLPSRDYTNPTIVKTGLGRVLCISKSGEYTYFSDLTAIKRFNDTVGSIETFLSKSVMSISLSSEYLYYADFFGNIVGRIGLQTKSDETLISGLNGPINVRYDEVQDRLYFLEVGTNSGLYKDGTLKVIEHVQGTRSHQGNIILTGNDLITIEGILWLNGSIITKENATLILRNAYLNLTQSSHYQFNITFQKPFNGNPRLQAENAVLNSTYWFLAYFYGNSSGTFHNVTSWFNSRGLVFIILFGTSAITISESRVRTIIAHDYSAVDVFSCFSMDELEALDYAHVKLSSMNIQSAKCYQSATLQLTDVSINNLMITSASINCSIFGLKPNYFSFWNYSEACSVVLGPQGWAPTITLYECTIKSWLLGLGGSSNATISDSIIARVETYSSSVAWLVNSTYGQTARYHESKIYVSWYLSTHVVDSIVQNVPYATVNVLYPNATMARSESTDPNGWADFVLISKMMNSTGDYPVGNYTIEASYGTHFNSTTVNMTGNREITLSLDFVIPEFPSLLILPLFMTATLLAVIVCRRKRISIG